MRKSMTRSRNEVRSTVRAFVECINSRDPGGLMAHQTEDFVFLDYDGDITRGRDGWCSYFENYPDYKIHLGHLVNSGKGVAIIGKTTGCHVGPVVEEQWTILWIAQVRDELVSEWRIYSDVHEVRERANIGGTTSEHLESIERVKSVVSRFIDCINAGDSEGLIALQTEDFTLIDYDGERFQGRDGWKEYFSACPDYEIHVKHLITSGNGVAILGRTTGSHVAPEVEEKETILWTAEIHDNLVAEWRLYSDTHDIEQEISAKKH
jgi:ketosteroid isomerase-like protein